MSEQYKISLGVELNTQGIQAQIEKIQSDKPIKIDIDVQHTKNQIEQIEKQIKNLSKIKVNLGSGAGGSSSSSVGKNIKSATQDYRELMSLIQRMTSTAKKGIGLDTKKDAQQITTLEGHLRNLETRYDNLFQSKGKNLSASQFNNIIREAEKAMYSINEMDAKFADARANFAKEIKLKVETGDIDKKVNEVIRKFEKVYNASDKLKNSKIELEGLRDSITSMVGNDDIDSVEKLKNVYEELETVLKKVDNLSKDALSQQKINNQAENLEFQKKAFSQKIDIWLKENSAAAKEFGDDLRKLQEQLKSCDAVGFRGIKSEFDQITSKAKLAGKATQTFGDKIKTQFDKYKSYLTVASVFMYAEMALEDMFRQVVAIDSAMTELKKVTDETDATYNSFLTNAGQRASEIGTTIDGLVSSTADFARLGYDFVNATGLAEVANIYAVVGDEINGVEGATESLISTMAAFKAEADGLSDSDFAMSIVDKMNEVSNNFAISSGGLGEALKRSSSAMYSANNSLDETIALITASNTVVQDADVVGNAYKTIALRIRGAKTELEEMGEDTSGMAESSAKLREELLALSGVDILEADGKTFKSTYDILNEISQVYHNLSDLSQANILEKLAGRLFCQNAQKCA